MNLDGGVRIPRLALWGMAFATLAGGCGGVERPPKNIPMPISSGATTSLTCKSAPVPAPQRTGSQLAFAARDGIWKGGWRVLGAVAATPFLTSPFVPAKLARPAWSAKQRADFPRSDAAVQTGGASSLVPIGGDYWAQTSHFIVPANNGPWVSSGYSMEKDAVVFQGEAAKGNLWTMLDAIPERYLVVAVGGGTGQEVGVELLVAPTRETTGCVPRGTEGPAARASRPPGSEDWVVAGIWHGSGEDAVVEHVFDTRSPTCRLEGRKALLRIFDFSSSEHVNVGHLAFAPTPPEPEHTPIWGFADFHAHPTSYLGLGGLQGIHTVWGVPGGAIKDYVGASRTRAYATDIPACDDPRKQYNAHHGGLAAPLMLNFDEHRTSADLGDLIVPELANVHASQGGASYHDFPDRLHGAHEQYHITQIYRAYLGGLRLMSALALQNEGLEYGVGWVRCSEDGNPTVDTTPDMNIIRAHVEVMKELAELNSEWMEIAYTPEDARRIIAANKLAVVLGTEVPRLGQLADDCEGDPSGCAKTLEAQIQELDSLGIRQLTIVHGMDNELGGTAIFQDLYNSVNDWMHRERVTQGESKRDVIDELSGAIAAKPFGPSAFFSVTTQVSPLAKEEDEKRDRILYRLTSPMRIIMSDVFPRPDGFTHEHSFFGEHLTFGQLHPLVLIAPLFKYNQSIYQDLGRGERNQRGLTGRGREFVERLMAHGMLIDLAHLSDEGIVDTLGDVREKCGQYPLMVSHAHFRALQVRTDYTQRTSLFVDRTKDESRKDAIDRVQHGGRSDSGRHPTSECVKELTACPARADYPHCNSAIMREASFARDQGPYMGEGTIDEQTLPREYDVTARESKAVWRSGGVMGLFLGQGTVDNEGLHASLGVVPNDCSLEPAAPLTNGQFRNDCSGSSKSFAAILRHAKRLANGQGALGAPGFYGVASDIAMTTSLPPRFGPDACGTYLDQGAGSASGAQLLEVMMEPSQYRVGEQRDAVVYARGARSCSVVIPSNAVSGIDCGSNAPLEPYALGSRTYDFNLDGMANYGLLPDMLQDTANVLGGESAASGDLDPLFHSAEGYVDMWERARAVAGVSTDSHSPVRHPNACGDACPHSFNGGAPMQSLGAFLVSCEDGEPVRLPTVDSCGRPTTASPIYAQKSTDPTSQVRARADGIVHQGDWAIFQVGDHPVWTCGDGKRRAMGCPAGTNYVQVRRMLDTQLSKPWATNCNWPPLPPENGNRAVVFECLSGPPFDDARNKPNEAAPPPCPPPPQAAVKQHGVKK